MSIFVLFYNILFQLDNTIVRLQKTTDTLNAAKDKITKAQDEEKAELSKYFLLFFGKQNIYIKNVINFRINQNCVTFYGKYKTYLGIVYSRDP